jgi:hypothetical protein
LSAAKSAYFIAISSGPPTWRQIFEDSAAVPLNDLSDVDVASASQFDLLFKANGNWEDTAGLLKWDGNVFSIFDTDGTDGIALSHDGAGGDFNFAFTNTADVLFTGARIVPEAYTEPFEVVSATNVITGAESGKTFYLNAVGGFTSTLPAPENGLRYRFIVSIAPTTAYIITTNAGANVLFGTINEITTTAGISVQAQDTLNFVASTSLIGDWIEAESDGTNWYVHGVTQVDDGITASVT